MRKIAFLLTLFFLWMFPVSAFSVSEEHSITWAGGGRGEVRFEGSEHNEKGYMCDTCHPVLFKMKKGGNPITMAAMAQGRFCGACHNGREAFATKDPEKCRECHKRGKHHRQH